MRRFAFVFALLLFPAAAASAQDGPTSRGDGLQFFSGSVGLGGGAGYEDGMIGTSVKVTLATRGYAFSARTTFGESGQFIDFASPARKFTEVALLAGGRDRFAGGWLMARAQAGPGFVIDYRRGARLPSDCDPRQLICLDANYEREVAHAIGMAGEAEVLLTPFRCVGMGLRVAGDVNAVRSFLEMSIAFHVGRLY